jgi:carbonic anhydrase/acetyltransferase-like protein (isoleucine patch superfamily)
MALIKELLGKTPEFGENVYLAETATIIGDVKMGKTVAYGLMQLLERM